MKLLVLGGGGMLGHKLCQVAEETMEVHASFRQAPDPAVAALFSSVHIEYPVQADKMTTVEATLDQVRPDVVVNCIGVVKQLDAGKDPVACLSINALFPHLLARACGCRGIRMITISTDCVFSGRSGNYREDDITDAEDLYGRTKALGEVLAPRCLTLRTSIIGRELSGAHGLVEWFLAQSRGSIRGYTRAVFSGLTTLELSRAIVRIMLDWSSLEGLYQVVADPICKYDLLCHIKDVYHLDVQIEPDDKLICNRSLDGSRFNKETGYVAPSWNDLINEMRRDESSYQMIGHKRSKNE